MCTDKNLMDRMPEKVMKDGSSPNGLMILEGFKGSRVPGFK